MLTSGVQRKKKKKKKKKEREREKKKEKRGALIAEQMGLPPKIAKEYPTFLLVYQFKSV